MQRTSVRRANEELDTSCWKCIEREARFEEAFAASFSSAYQSLFATARGRTDREPRGTAASPLPPQLPVAENVGRGRGEGEKGYGR